MTENTETLRIVSLCPSATETAYALGLGPSIVGVSHQCDFPPEVSGLPRLTRSFVEDLGDSALIHQVIASNKERWGTIYDVDEELLAQLRPEIILTQEVCKVCAYPADAALEVAGRRLNRCLALPFRADRVQDILNSIRELGEAAGVPERSRQLVSEISETRASIRAVTSKLPRKKSFMMEWIDPVRNSGHWIPELMEAAGGDERLANRDGQTEVSWEDVAAFGPEVILISPCGFDFERALEEIHKFRQRAGWQDVPAVRRGQVFLGNGKIITRYTPRIPAVLRAMAHMIHPEHFPSFADPEIIRKL
ncbi:MAG: ABC transporter substrate-binding protein [Acidobacteriota bacterium]